MYSAFFSLICLYLLRKNKMHGLGDDRQERKGESEQAVGGFGRNNKKYCTYNTFFIPLSIKLLTFHSVTSSFLLFNSISH